MSFFYIKFVCWMFSVIMLFLVIPWYCGMDALYIRLGFSALHWFFSNLKVFFFKSQQNIMWVYLTFLIKKLSRSRSKLCKTTQCKNQKKNKAPQHQISCDDLLSPSFFLACSYWSDMWISFLFLSVVLRLSFTLFALSVWCNLSSLLGNWVKE